MLFTARRAALAALCLTLLPVTSAHAATQATLYAAPNGSGTACTQAAPCSLDGARTKVRGMTAGQTGDIVVTLAGGTYRLAGTFTLGSADSGRNGHKVIWTAAAGATPVLNGGKVVSGWQKTDAAKEIWRAPLPSGATPRQLYVNGSPRPRAAAPGCVKAVCPVSTTGLGGAAATGIGALSHPEDVELSMKQRWRNYRCGVSSVSGDTLVMEQPCWKNSLPGTNRTSPAWDNTTVDKAAGVEFFENAYEFIDAPGEWFADIRAGYVYYKVLYPGSDPNGGTVEVPVVETLLQLSGTTADPVHDIEIDGITFAYSTWNQPKTTEGYAGTQAGLSLLGFTGPSEMAGRYYSKPAAAVTVRTGRNIVFSDSTFTHLGGAGLKLEAGTQHSTVTRNTFTDISNGGVYVGDTEPDPTPELTSLDNTVSYNRISWTGKEFTDSVAIWAGYDAELVIDHNTLSNLPYSGISVGWGWNQPEARESALRDNQITNNAITNVMMPSAHQHDGGGIYTQGAQPRSVITGNYVNRSAYANTERDGNGIYLDEQSSYLTVERNVVTRVGYKWVSNWASWGINNTVTGNWSDTVAPALSGTGSTMTNNQTALLSLPAEALAVANAAGAGGTVVEQLAVDHARGKTATQSSTSVAASAANDGNTTNYSSTTSQSQPYWQVDLGSAKSITQVELWNGNAWGSLTNFTVLVSDNPFTSATLAGAKAEPGVTWYQHAGTSLRPSFVDVGRTGRYVRIQLANTATLSLAEVKVH
ncbi:right-handed parallel beta-helix repeat-containing protein [Actinokineospora sp. HUAS TT18]|uniref:right-handed parallel beta-helix repeat-containing protein n=1 Tax=Actinokineospora sp. HUAS TT18 TaxID=3447451 RepID=UPI003F521700